MINEIKKLPDAELEIMLVIWKTGNPVSSSYISDQLRNKRNWALATLMTVLSRLVDKGFLYCEKEGRSNSYRAAISETDYKECEGKSTLEKLFGNSIQDMVMSLYNGKAIDRNDLAELREMLDRVEREES
ncbi:MULTISPECIES: BlaI/MecI/CopY family transcriptional regulator [Paenibacillus]|jgi:BlaI family penicillinase repressor|uniref:BlaI/MecI/CopY family transcriptional regulator n=1 Tax=Paenibacillus TaxID=44249 RepID=UPI00096D1106|nr:BlaI/MecI/CopY family transcriptional regulator [Paenibacillus odorifer]OMD91403.1 CopY family transcriptional regulator [Paenibacillus odorifer]